MCIHAKLCQLSLTLCDPMDYSLPGSSVHGIFQTRIMSGLPWLPLQGNLPDPGIKPWSLLYPVLAGGFFITSTIWNAKLNILLQYNATIMLLNIYQNELNNYPHKCSEQLYS